MQWALAGKWGVHNCVVLGSWGSICSWGSVPDHIKHLKFKIKLKSIGWSWKAPNASILHMLKSFFEANCTFLFPMCFVCVCTRMCARTCLWRPQFVNCFTSPPSSLSLFPPPLSLNLELTNCVYFLASESLGFACFCPQALHSSAQQMHSTHPGFSMDLRDTSSGPQAFTAFLQVPLPYPEVTTSPFHAGYTLWERKALQWSPLFSPCALLLFSSSE